MYNRKMVFSVLMVLLQVMCVLFISACSSRDKEPSYRVTHVITCKHWLNQCYYKAQAKCEGRKYEVVSKTETERTGGPYGRYREFTVRIGCL